MHGLPWRRMARRWRQRGLRRRVRRPQTAARNVAIVWLVAAIGIAFGIAWRFMAPVDDPFHPPLGVEGQARWHAGMDALAAAIPGAIVALTGRPSWPTAVLESTWPAQFIADDDGGKGGDGKSAWKRLLELGLSMVLGYDTDDEEAVLASALPRSAGGSSPPMDGTVSAAEAPAAPPIRVAVSAPGPPPPPLPADEGPAQESIAEPSPDDGVQTVLAGGREPLAEPERIAGVREEVGQDYVSTTGTCRVLIFHSHTSETYRTDDFSPTRPDEYHVWNSSEAGIVHVGRVLARTLDERYAVPACHAVAVHDWPSHARAYIQSRTTVAQYLQRYPHIDLVVDVHRDSPPDLVATVAGRPVARLALVVGTHPSMHPHSATNVAVAQHIGRLLESKYPGLFRRVIERPDARLNQDLHPHMVLVEVGSYDNHLDEALAAAELLADVLADTVYALRTGGLDGADSPR